MVMKIKSSIVKFESDLNKPLKGILQIDLLIFTFSRNTLLEIFRSTRPEVFCKKCVLENFTKFTGKRLSQSFFFNEVAGLRPKKRPWCRCFPANFVKFLKTSFL